MSLPTSFAHSCLGAIQSSVLPLGLEALIAIVVASVLGSVHCIGMCGPFLTLATGNGTAASHASRPRSTSILQSSASLLQIPYHLGRLTTYLTLGVAAGSLANLLNATLEQTNAPRWLTVGGMVGATILSIGVWRSLESIPTFSSGSADHAAKPSPPPRHRTSKLFLHWGNTLARVRKRFQSRSRPLNAYLWGVFTTLLPCGWLYLFVIVAIASPTILGAAVTMLAFWIGTLPALGIFGIVWNSASAKMRWLQSPLTSCIILGLGLFLMIDRSAAQLFSQSPPPAIAPSTSTGEAPGTSDANTTALLIQLRQSLNSGLPHCGPFHPSIFPIPLSIPPDANLTP